MSVQKDRRFHVMEYAQDTRDKMITDYMLELKVCASMHTNLHRHAYILPFITLSPHRLEGPRPRPPQAAQSLAASSLSFPFSIPTLSLASPPRF